MPVAFVFACGVRCCVADIAKKKKKKLAVSAAVLLKLLKQHNIKSSTEIQSSAIIVHEAKRTATGTRTTHTTQNNPYRLDVVVKFRGYSGGEWSSQEGYRGCVPISPVDTAWQDGGTQVRTHLPLRLCWAITMQKSQGQTLDKAVIDLGPKEACTGRTFVCLSRAKRLVDLMVKPMNFDRIDNLGNSSTMKARL